MSRLVILGLLLWNSVAFSYDAMPHRDPWQVISDTLDPSLPHGAVIVYGKVVQDPGLAVGKAIVATHNRSVEVMTNESGEYLIMLTEKDSALFCYHPEFGEVVIWRYDFKSQHRVHINFYLYKEQEGTQTVKKPVIYLYADTGTQVELRLDYPGLTFAYPSYENSWKVQTMAGAIQNLADQQIYPYLFWEGVSDIGFFTDGEKIPGDLVRTDSIVPYLENTLSQLGLNSREQTDFITFWGPELVQKPYVFIQFMVDEQVNQNVALLDVVPTPGSSRRIFMQFMLLDLGNVPFAFITQEFPTFERKGLTLVEWGGSEVDSRRIEP